MGNYTNIEASYGAKSAGSILFWKKEKKAKCLFFSEINNIHNCNSLEYSDISIYPSKFEQKHFQSFQISYGTEM